jgi:molybdenum cofactor cytidylyltransferase
MQTPNEYPIHNCEILIIAAGQSKRLGKPKQLLAFEGKSLINRLIEITKLAGTYPTTLVLGANADKITTQLQDKHLTVVMNEQWEEGMASSIRAGVKSIIQASPNMDGIMILVCDQPFINVENINGLIALQLATGKPIAACYYANVLGTPALFHKSIFPDLLELKGDIGAKKIIKNKEEEVAKLHFEKGVLDIDTEADYKQLLKEENK